MNNTGPKSMPRQGPAYSMVLPELRQDLEIMPCSSGRPGDLNWVIHDHLQHRYFQIDKTTKDILSLWQPGETVGGMILAAHNEFGHVVVQQQIEQLAEFVQSRNLTIEDEEASWREMSRRAASKRRSVSDQLMHTFLFTKVPLVRPQKALQALLPHVEWLYARGTVIAISLLGIVGLYLTSRQWEAFIGTFHSFFSIEGMLCFALALTVVKLLHELGHAFTAVRYGCNVPTMGVAFILAVPLPYTDVSDVWRLRSRQQRILIGAAGVLVELALASLALFLWAFLPDGILRGVVFLVATTSLFLSLVLNLNPFMKFDGYYILADLLSIDNLQTRSFALGRWKLRSLLFAPRSRPPEALPKTTKLVLIAYAWMTWLYRLIVFTTLAILAYNYCFKLLGLALFALEIWYFVVRPVALEVNQWRRLDPQVISRQRIILSASLLSILLVTIIVPWSTTINLPAILQADEIAQVYPPRAGKLIAVNAEIGTVVQRGEEIARFTDPVTDHGIIEVKTKIDLTEMRLASALENRADLDKSLVLRSELASLRSKLNGLLAERRELIIRAPISGVILEVNREVHPERWVSKSDPLALIADIRRRLVKGYIPETDLWRIKGSVEGLFIPDDLTRPSFPVKLTNISPAGVKSIDIRQLASTNGGGVPVKSDAANKLVPLSAQYLVDLRADEVRSAPDQVVRGLVRLSGQAESILARAWRQIASVLIRESGF